MTLRRLPILLLVAIVLAVLPVGTAAADSSAERELICLTNQVRASAGQAPLRVASDLNTVARRHSVVMADRGHLHHNPNLGSDVRNWQRVGENVGVGPSIGSIHQALMDSPGHRANIMDGRFTELGIGVERRGSRYWVTQVFRTPSGSNAGSVPSCGGSSPQRGTPVVGDWNGDGLTTPATFRDGRWELSNSLTGRVDLSRTFGRAGDRPIVGDWNGDGRTGIGVIRGNRWILSNSTSRPSSDHVFDYGRITSGDVPIAGDWNGNGRDGIGIIRDGEWHLRSRLSSGPGERSFVYGRITRGDVPIIGDWNGNGRDGIGIVRGGQWHLRNAHSAGPAEHQFIYGRVLSGDRPVVGDWNGSGRAGVGIVRGSDWYLKQTTAAGNADLVIKR